MKTFDKHLIRFLIVSLCYLDVAITPAQAAMISTSSITAAGQAESPRQKLLRYLEREDVRAGLEQKGVTPAAAKARVDALSDDEVAAVAGKIDTLPAGGEFIGALVFIFVLLLITDILGFTKIYSFTRPVRK
ncbi:MAG: PA2779 family protein [Burkholderiales bacterium]